MAKGFFITGTDTGVGKTIISGAIIKALQYLGVRACGMKPVETGCGREGDVLIPYDGMFLKQIAQMEESIAVVTPCRFESPLAPLIASEMDGIQLSLHDITSNFIKLRYNYNAIVVEGIGGLLVPLRKDYFVSDLAKEMDLPLIIVARPGLGTINHIMLTVRQADASGLQVAGIILNHNRPPENSLAEETNPKLLAQVCPVPLIGVFPYLKSTDEDEIAMAALKNFDLELIRKFVTT
jgi:dethiobiotin synthetase